MAYNHNSIVLAKRKFGLHLSYVIRHLTAKDITQRELAQLAKVSQSVISSIKNDHSERLSLPIMMKVADAIRLKYQITFNSVKGRCSVTVHVESALATTQIRPLNVQRKIFVLLLTAQHTNQPKGEISWHRELRKPKLKKL